MSDEMVFNMVYYGTLFSYVIIGIAGVLLGHSQIKFDNLSENKLNLAKEKSKQGMLIYFIITFFLPMAFIPLYIIYPKIILLIQFIILFLIISSSITFMSFFLRYFSIRKKLKCGEHDSPD